jgi:hypothetical protein
VILLIGFSRTYTCVCLAMVQNKGLHRMNAPDGRKVFIQFSCAPNKIAMDNLFNKYLLFHIQKKNIPVDEVFHDIAKSVYQKRHRRLQPFSNNELPDDKPVYLNFATSCTYRIELKRFYLTKKIIYI